MKKGSSSSYHHLALHVLFNASPQDNTSFYKRNYASNNFIQPLKKGHIQVRKFFKENGISNANLLDVPSVARIKTFSRGYLKFQINDFCIKQAIFLANNHYFFSCFTHSDLDGSLNIVLRHIDSHGGFNSIDPISRHCGFSTKSYFNFSVVLCNNRVDMNIKHAKF